jgi:hypothetical protein
MAISYPLTPPAALEASRLSMTGMSAISRNISPFTMQVQQYNWSGQGWLGTVECPPMTRAAAEQVVSFLLMAQRGTFYFQDFANPTPRGNVTGTLTVSSATANGTTLGISGATGSFAAGDWLQISTSLYKVVQVNSSSSVDVFPVLRSSYAGGTAITYNNAKGVFRLAEPSTQWSIDTAKFYGVSFNVMEDVAQ